ncbi:Aste57867_333 [Aphanomyces stellatus]|uniref:Aste57867_333 protein n=1 Tax=Aphanomyces stellatus TaxID=120398 RepID=A0A485K4V0_9STRA|nr:hypothetical protein As57867_000333 [Aphanomyces stellatus]VFT77559.1 Aste57867_333 [Aphanomyces stellatus]
MGKANKGNKKDNIKAAVPAKKVSTTKKVAMEPGFFGGHLASGHSFVLENTTEDMALRLDGAALGHDASAGPTTLFVSTERRDVKIALCTLDLSKTPQWTLNCTFTPSEGAVTFSTKGPNTIHLSAYIDAEMDEDIDDEDAINMFMDRATGDDDDDDDDEDSNDGDDGDKGEDDDDDDDDDGDDDNN